jgi:predicted AAA+ superfamily ATPase
LFIRKKTQESLAGRIYEFNLDVLSFEEFLVFRDKEELIQKKKLLQEAVKKEFLLYQKRQFIETVSESEEKVAQYVKTIIEKIVFQDIPRIFPIEHEELLLRILKIISSNPGMLSDYQSLSNELGISRVTLSNYFFYLEESFLIRKLYNFSDNMLTSEKKMKKFYLISTAFFSFLNSSIDEPKLVENLLVNSTHARFFWRTPQKYEVDIILQKDGKIIPIEVKYQENISKKELKNLIRFCEAFKVGRAIIITKSQIGEKTENNVKVKLIPAWLFLLEEE